MTRHSFVLSEVEGRWHGLSFWAYILECSDGLYYTGHTDDLEPRIAEHQYGRICTFTARRRPLALKWTQEFPSRLEALEAEQRIKSWSRAKKGALIEGDWASLSYFAKPPHERPSTSLGTNGEEKTRSTPFVSSEVETPVRKRVI